MGKDNEAKRCCHRFGNCIGFQCCSDVDGDNPVPYLIPNKDRFCTDIIWCILLIFVVISQGFLIEFAIEQGSDTRWLFHGIDINGIVCDDTHPNGENLAMWPFVIYYDIVVCTDSCNKTMTDPRILLTYESEVALNSWCLPSDEGTRDLFDSSWNSVSESLNRAVGDVVISKYMIIASIFISLFFCFVYMGYIGVCGGVIVWVTIIFSILGGGFLSYALIAKSEEVIAMGWKFTGNLMLYTGWTLAVITMLFTLGIIFMRSRIALAIRVIKEAASALQSTPSIIFFPMLCSFVAAGYLIFWGIGALYLYSVAVFTTYTLPSELQVVLGQTDYLVDEFDTEIRDYLVYHIFGLFWVLQFIIYFCYMIMAHVFSEWYFAKQDDNGKRITGKEEHEFSKHPIFKAIFRVCRYHLGTIAFGSFIVATIKFANAVLTYLQGKTAKKSNPVAVAIFSCVKCLLKCLECCIDILSKNGFVFTAVYGTPFCHSCRNAFKVFFNNLARVAAVTVISNYLEFLGKMSITILTTGICIFAMQEYDYFVNNLSSLFFPTIIILVISYGISYLFMVVFEVAIDTIFLCFLIDEQCHLQGTKYATDEFKKLIDEHSEESKKKAHHIKSSTMAHKGLDNREELVEMEEYHNNNDRHKKRKKVKRRNHNDGVKYVNENKSSYREGY